MGVVLVVVAAEHTALATITSNLAEGFVMLVLAPLAFDVIDRTILTPGAASSLRVRQAWWLALVVLPVGFIVLRHAHLGAPLAAVVLYATRAQEAFVGILLMEFYFGLRGSGATPPLCACPTC